VDAEPERGKAINPMAVRPSRVHDGRNREQALDAIEAKLSATPGVPISAGDQKKGW